MPDASLVADHYTHGGLLGAIEAGVERLGKTVATVEIADLGPVEEFHIGGRVATEAFLDQVDLQATDTVLDVGCGLGGASRFAAHKYQCAVEGIDLTEEYVETGKVLCEWIGLGDRVSLRQGDATNTPFAADSFDKAFMLHVGMNIADKAGLARELFRLLKPGGVLGIYDVMQIGDGELQFPVPWASTAEGSSLGRVSDYTDALTQAGFSIRGERNRREFALEFFENLRASASAAAGPPPLGLHILMGESAPIKVGNMIENISAGRIAPVEIIAEKPV